MEQFSDNNFKILHSTLIMEMQCIEQDLKIIYAAIKEGDFDENYDILSRSNLGKTISELYYIDGIDNVRDLEKEDYKNLEKIREKRNYWCHQCYLDFVYITDEKLKAARYGEILSVLEKDYNMTKTLASRISNLRARILEKYDRLSDDTD